MSNKIIITEEQYSRLFLNEQRIVDKKDNTNVGKESQNPYGITSKSYTGPTKYVQAQNQWKLLGAENPKTGRSIVDNDTVNNLKNLRDGAINDWNQNNKKPEELSWNVRRDQDSNSPEKIIPNYMSPTQRFDMDKGDEMSKINKEFPYNDVLKYNENIKQQNTLIPEWCKKPNLFKWSTEKMNEEDPQDQKRLKSLKIKYPIHNIGWRQPKGREYGYYISYRVDTGRDPFVHCNKDSLKGVWVYKTKIGYHCGCMVDDNGQQYMDNSGTYTTDYALGFHQKIKKHEKDNQPGFLDSVADWIGSCSDDYHCLLDLASIAVLVIPVWGVALSWGLDVINSAAYGVEAYTADNAEDRSAAAIAGGLTLFGGFLGGGYGTTKRLITAGASNPNIYKYTANILTDIETKLPGVKTIKTIKNKKILDQIYDSNKIKYGLSKSEVITSTIIMKTMKNIPIEMATKYMKTLNVMESKKFTFSLLEEINEKGFKKILQLEGGDVIMALNRYVKIPKYKELLIQMGAFIGVQEALKIPIVSEWVRKAVNSVSYMAHYTPRNLVESYGYPWEQTREIFMSDKSGADNTLLKLAWEEGWRPWGINIKNPTQSDTLPAIEWLKKHSKFQTKTFKDSGVADIISNEGSKYEVTPVEGEKKENVKYLDSEKLVNAMNSEWSDDFEELIVLDL